MRVFFFYYCLGCSFHEALSPYTDHLQLTQCAGNAGKRLAVEAGTLKIRKIQKV